MAIYAVKAMGFQKGSEITLFLVLTIPAVIGSYLIGRLVVTAPILNAALHDERRRKAGDATVQPVSMSDLGIQTTPHDQRGEAHDA